MRVSQVVVVLLSVVTFLGVVAEANVGALVDNARGFEEEEDDSVTPRGVATPYPGRIGLQPGRLGLQPGSMR